MSPVHACKDVDARNDRSTCCLRLDGLLSAGVHLTGGYRDGQLIEFVGESGSGKTQARDAAHTAGHLQRCMCAGRLQNRVTFPLDMLPPPQVCLLAAAANAARGTSVLYIDTGNAFSTQRLKSLLEALPDVQKVWCRLPRCLLPAFVSGVHPKDACKHLSMTTHASCRKYECLLQCGASLEEVLGRIQVHKAFEAQVCTACIL